MFTVCNKSMFAFFYNYWGYVIICFGASVQPQTRFCWCSCLPFFSIHRYHLQFCINPLYQTPPVNLGRNSPFLKIGLIRQIVITLNFIYRIVCRITDKTRITKITCSFLCQFRPLAQCLKKWRNKWRNVNIAPVA